MVQYEWCIETYTKDDTEDIINNCFSDTLLLFDESAFAAEPGEATRLVLVRNEGDEVNGLENRLWAYVKDNKLPVYFEDGGGYKIDIRVPVKFHKELQKYFKRLPVS